MQITPDGSPATGRPGETIIPRDDETERKILAKRLVADRCIYGVDKNPLAVEMGKLSLWLTTLSKGRAFTFLDHALKCGDSLVGVSMEQLRYWNLQPEGQEEMFVGSLLQPVIDYAIDKRRQLESFTVVDVNDQQAKAALYAEAEAATAYLKTAADHLIAETMGVSAGSVLADVVATFKAMADEDDLIAALRDHPLNPPDGLDFPPFHWELEYPEVFQRGGFSAFVGNPPFQSGKGGENSVTATFGSEYVSLLEELYIRNKRSADISAYFFWQARLTLAPRGTYGLVVTNTIAEGTTRQVALDPLFEGGGSIYRAKDSFPWPGKAVVFISIVHAVKGFWEGNYTLDEKQVTWIDSRLQISQQTEGEPRVLEKTFPAFHGTKPRGKFPISPSEIPSNIEIDMHFPPFLSGSDVNKSPEQLASRHILYFPYEDEETAYSANSLAFELLRERLFDYRQGLNEQPLRDFWWKYEYEAEDLYEYISKHNFDKVLVSCRVSNLFMVEFVTSKQIFADGVVVFATDAIYDLSVLQSSIFHVWVRRYCSTFKGDIRFNVKDVVVKYVMPTITDKLVDIGERYHKTRRQIMLDRQEGLTDTYNRFHDPDETSEDIQHLRELHVEMDTAVAAAYGWDDLDLGHDFHETAQGVRFTISEAARREVLTRLLKLNHERYAQECHEGLHKPKDCAAFFAEHPEYQRKVDWDKMMQRKKSGDQPEQQELFDDDNPQKRLL